MRAALRCFAGFLLACAAGAAVQVLFVLTPLELWAGGIDLMGTAGILWLLATLQAIVLAAPFALVAAIIAERRAFRGIAFYLLACVVFALVIFLIRLLPAPLPPSVAGYLLLVTLVAGLAAGLTYWAVAGRKAGQLAENEREGPKFTRPAMTGKL